MAALGGCGFGGDGGDGEYSSSRNNVVRKNCFRRPINHKIVMNITRSVPMSIVSSTDPLGSLHGVVLGWPGGPVPFS